MSRCLDCRFWNLNVDHGREVHEWEIGRCKRHAPTVKLVVTLTEHHDPETTWPRTKGTDGCGDFELRPADHPPKEA